MQFLQENIKVRNLKYKSLVCRTKREKNMSYLRAGCLGECFDLKGSDRKMEEISLVICTVGQTIRISKEGDLCGFIL